MGKIQLLSEELINKIAAGEVVENPSSVVKELVENAIDAGSTKIEVSIKGGGELLISIADNGCGMEIEDAFLALKRHATSKIKTLDDLQKIKTLGFRGEALAAIASVSKLTLESSCEENEGIFIETEGGEITQHRKSGRARGTTIEVRSLFYNTPARKKFQKSAQANSAEINKVMQHLSLAHPNLSFQLTSQDKEMLMVKQNNDSFDVALKKRIEELFDKDFATELLSINLETFPFKLIGFLAAPHHARKNRSGNFLFINQRSVFSIAVSQAMKEGFSTRLPEGFFPVFFLHLTIDPNFVDVNVHPQKKEVRLRDEWRLKEVIQDGIDKAFQKSSVPDFINTSFANFSENSHFSFSKEQEEAFLFEKETLAPQENSFLPIKAIAILHSYLFVVEGEELKLIDLGAASSRLLFDAIHKQNGNYKQTLVIPLSLEFSQNEIDQLGAHIEDFQKLGFDLRIIGKKTIAIDAIPQHLEYIDLKELILKIYSDLSSCGKSNLLIEEQKKKLAQTICRNAKRRKVYSLQEGMLLFQESQKSQDPNFDPLGNPIHVKIMPEDLAKLLRR